MASWIVWLVIAVLVISVLGFLLKSFIRVVLVFAVIAILFRIAFVWSADEVQSYLFLDRILKPEYQERIEQGLEGFTERRSETEVIDAEALEGVVVESISGVAEDTKDKLKEIDTQQVMDALNEKMESIDTAELEAEIKRLLEELKSKDSEE